MMDVVNAVREWVRGNKAIAAAGAIAIVAGLAWLAFGFFGIHTLFVDDVVDEAAPVFESGLTGDDVGADTLAAMDVAMEVDGIDATVEVDEDMPMAAPQEASETDEMEIMTIARGEFIGRIHPGEGQVLVLNDGSEQRFLRFEEFEVDNGPDLNVYLVAGATADGEAGLFDDDVIDLGDLTGNIGPQNYEIPVDVDLDRYDTVVIWCVRFGVAFAAADLA